MSVYLPGVSTARPPALTAYDHVVVPCAGKYAGSTHGWSVFVAVLRSKYAQLGGKTFLLGPPCWSVTCTRVTPDGALAVPRIRRRALREMLRPPGEMSFT